MLLTFCLLLTTSSNILYRVDKEHRHERFKFREVLVDGGDIIVHLFRPEVRSIYNLEKMWDVDFDQQVMEHVSYRLY